MLRSNKIVRFATFAVYHFVDILFHLPPRIHPDNNQRRADSFDEKTGLTTAGSISPFSLDSINWNYLHSSRYQPIDENLFQKAISQIPIDPRNFAFIDLGCGKGRALFLAAMAGFRKVIGVELSPLLVKCARENLERLNSACPIEIDCADACYWELPKDDAVIFMYNPFDATILEKVMTRIEKSLLQWPRLVWIVYVNPLHAKVLHSHGWIPQSAQEPNIAVFQTPVNKELPTYDS